VKRPLTAREDGRYRPERDKADRCHTVDTNGEFTPLDGTLPKMAWN